MAEQGPTRKVQIKKKKKKKDVVFVVGVCFLKNLCVEENTD